MKCSYNAPDNCLKTAWSTFKVCLKFAWSQLKACLRAAWILLADWLLTNCCLTADWLLLTSDWLLEDLFQKDEERVLWHGQTDRQTDRQTQIVTSWARVCVKTSKKYMCSLNIQKGDQLVTNWKSPHFDHKIFIGQFKIGLSPCPLSHIWKILIAKENP